MAQTTNQEKGYIIDRPMTRLEPMPPKDDRVTLKMDRALWRKIEELIKGHPEWGIVSVSDFVRRAIDSEIRARKEEDRNRVIDLCFAPESEGRRRKGQ